jgi:hypothetical protein
LDSHELIQLLSFVLDRKKRERRQQIMSYSISEKRKKKEIGS